MENSQGCFQPLVKPVACPEPVHICICSQCIAQHTLGKLNSFPDKTYKEKSIYKSLKWCKATVIFNIC